MRKKQSVTQRVVLEGEDGPIIRDEAQDETDPPSNTTEEQGDDLNGHSQIQNTATESLDSSSADATPAVEEGTPPENPSVIDTIKVGTGKERTESVDQPDLFDEDGNAILPDGTLIIQPTDVDGDRPSSGPVAAPNEGSSLQFDFKDGNPDPKYILSSQSAGNAGGMAGGQPQEPGVLDIVKCTTCTTKLSPYHKDDVAVHPVLKVITCKRCMRWYNSVDWSKDEDGKDNQCRWCGEGGQLICCDVCHNTFCKTCIKRNLGRTILQEIEDLPEDALWRCYVCDQGPLLPLQQSCAQTLEKVEAYRMGKLQRKFKLQNAKKQVENKKPIPITPTTVTVPVTPIPSGVRPQIGARMTAPSVTPSGMMGPRSSIAATPSNMQRGQFSGRLVPSMQRGPRLPMPMLMNSGMNQRPGMQSAQNRYPGSQLGRPPTTVRSMRPVRPPMGMGQNRGPQGSMTLNSASTGAAGSNAATEEWYEQNCSLREILREVNSVDPSNIELALKTTLKELQSWTRKCNHLENELRGALNDAQRRTVVHKFKSTFRLNLLLRLGKIHTLMQKESGLQMAVAAQRSAVMAVQAQNRPPNLPTSMLNANAKKMMVPTRPMVPTIRSVQPTGRVTTGGVIDLTEDSSSVNKTAPSASSTPTAQQPTRLPNLGRPPTTQSAPINAMPSSTAVSAAVVASSSSPGRIARARRSVNSTHVSLVSSDEDEEEEEKDHGMIDDRTDKTWTGYSSRKSGLRRKSARLAAKSVSVTEGSDNESNPGGEDHVDESDDSQSRLVVRLPIGKRVKKRRMSGEDDDDSKLDAEEGNDEDSKLEDGDNPVKDEAMEVVVDQSVIDSEKAETCNKPKDTHDTHDRECKKENGETTIISNGISSAEDSNSQESKLDKTDESPPEKAEDDSESKPTNEEEALNSPKNEDGKILITKELEEELLNETSETNEEPSGNDKELEATAADTCITVSMWGPSDEGSDNDISTLKRKASDLEMGEEAAKRQKLDE